jgi:hypothetical protein
MKVVNISIFITKKNIVGNEVLEIYVRNSLIDRINIQSLIYNKNYDDSNIVDICPDYMRELPIDVGKSIRYVVSNMNSNDISIVQVYHKTSDSKKNFDCVLIELVSKHCFYSRTRDFNIFKSHGIILPE